MEYDRANIYIKSFLKVPNQTVSHQIRDNVYTLYNRHLIYEDQKYTAITCLLYTSAAGNMIFVMSNIPIPSS